MSKKENEVYKKRNHRVILYCEDPSHVKALEIIKSNYDYAYILHDKDTYLEDKENETGLHKVGELKKPHWHVVLSNKKGNSIYNTALAKKLGIEKNYIKVCDYLDEALLYLIHFQELEKYQYPIDDVISNCYIGRLKNEIAKQNNNNLSEPEAVEYITKHIYSLVRPVDRLYLINFCAKQGISKYYRQYRYEFDSALLRQMAAIRYRIEHDDFKYGGSKYNFDNPNSDGYVDEDGFIPVPDDIDINDIFPSKS